MTSPHSPAAKKAPLRPLASALMVVLAGVLRLIPTLKPPNVAPIGALALFGGARLPLWQSLLMVFVPMAISDMLLRRLYGWEPFSPFVYGSFAVYVLLGRLVRLTRSPGKIAIISLLASAQFYVITNFGVWYEGLGRANALYPPTAAGLLESYIMGLPFFGFTVAGDLGFAFVLFGAYDWLAAVLFGTKRVPAEAAQ